MKRIGLLFAAVAVLLLAGVVALVARALESVEQEEAMRHQVVASRLFDEVERELTALTEREEARSFLEYRTLYVPQGQLPGNKGLSLSPLAGPPADDFVLGYFQIDPDGVLQLPWRPRPGEQQLLAENDLEQPGNPYPSDDEALLRHLALGLRAPADARGGTPGATADVEAPLPGATGLDDGAAAIAEPVGRPHEAQAAPARERTLDAAPASDAVAPDSDEVADASSPDPVPAVQAQAALAPQAGEDERFRPAWSSKERDDRQQAVQKEAEDTSKVAVSTAGQAGPRREASAKKPSSEADWLGELNTGGKSRSGRQPRRAPYSQGETEVFQSDRRLDPTSGEQASAPVLASQAGEDAWSGRYDQHSASGDASGEAEAAAVALPQAPAADGYGDVQGEVAFTPLPAEGQDHDADEEGPPVPGTRGTDAAEASGPDGRRSVEKDGGVEGDLNAAAEPPPQMCAENASARRSRSQDPARQEQVPGFGIDLSSAGPLPSPVEGRQSANAPAGPAPEPQLPRAPQADSVPAQAREGQAAGPEQGRRAGAATSRGPTGSQPLSPPAATGNGDAVDVTVEPLVGRRVDPDHLVLHRAVHVGPDAYTQGLVLRLPELARHVHRKVVAGGELEQFVTLTWQGLSSASDEAAPSRSFRFEHSFAEPFGQLAASVVLTRLPTDAGRNPRAWVLLLAVLLGVVGLLGFGALYRAVAVVVQFAERRNNFVAAVSHELKTPLTAIRMYGEILRDGMVTGPERRQEYYETITTESERLSRLIDNVLELSRLEKGTRTMALEAGDPSPVVQDAVRLLSAHARDCGFELATETGPALPAVRFDRDALLQVLINLVDNAIKFGRWSERKLVVIQCRAEGAGVQLCVRDCGPGVPSAQLRRIFQPFYRGERELTRTTKGTGIGLALVRGLIEQMGGRVGARNLQEGGFEVSISLA